MQEFIELGASPEKVTESVKAPRVFYPHLSITSDEPIDLGESGEALIRYKKIESGERKADGKMAYRCELEVHGIKPTGKGKSERMEKPKGKSFSESLDEAMEDDDKDY